MSEVTEQLPAMESAESAPTEASKRDPILIVIAVLLALILVVQLYTIVDTRQQRQSAEERAVLAAEAEQERLAAEEAKEMETARMAAEEADLQAEADAAYAEQLAEAAASILLFSALQDDLAADLLENYQDDAYDNPLIDRIAEQQLIATEYQIVASQMLGLQNQAIIDLLALQYELPDAVVAEDSAE